VKKLDFQAETAIGSCYPDDDLYHTAIGLRKPLRQKIERFIRSTFWRSGSVKPARGLVRRMSGSGGPLRGLHERCNGPIDPFRRLRDPLQGLVGPHGGLTNFCAIPADAIKFSVVPAEDQSKFTTENTENTERITGFFPSPCPPCPPW